MISSAPQRVPWGAIILFALLAVALGAFWAAHARAHGMLKDPQSAGIAAALAQPTVLIAALIAMALFARASFRQIGWRLGPLRAYAMIAAVVVALVVFVSAISLAAGFLHLTVASAPTPAQLAISLPILFLVSCLFSFCEEFSWRGFLLPNLLSLGPRPALLLSGLIWFLWEAPLVYFGLLDSTMIQVNLPLTLACHFVQTLAVAVALGWLRLRFGSIFLPTFAHGLLNTMGGLSFMFLFETNPIWGDFGGPIATALLLLLAAVIWRRPLPNEI